MKDIPLMSVTQVLDDSTGIWANDLCEISIHSARLETFLKTYGDEGAKEIIEMLDILKKDTLEELNKIKKGK